MDMECLCSADVVSMECLWSAYGMAMERLWRGYGVLMEWSDSDGQTMKESINTQI